MPLTIPPELKKITPYVRRAEELDKDKANAESRLVAYYSRQYAVHTGIDLATSAAGKTCLGELLSALEQEKPAMDSFTREEAKFLCRKFADKIFDKADLEDRTGSATKDTAKTFYAAASFLEILNQFYKKEEDSEEIAEIRKRAVYGKWKATEILKAIKEGRQPTPGGYGEEEVGTDETEPTSTETGAAENTLPTENEEEKKLDDGPTEPDGPVVRWPSTENNDGDNEEEIKIRVESESEEEVEEGTEVQLGPPPAYDFAPPPMVPPPVAPPPPVAKPPMTFTPPPPVPAMPPPPATTQPEKKPRGGIFGFGKKNKSKLSKAEFADAMELTKFAMAALDDKNSELAAERLQQALDVLNQKR